MLFVAQAEVERETGFVIPGTKTPIEFAYRLTNEDTDPALSEFRRSVLRSNGRDAGRREGTRSEKDASHQARKCPTHGVAMDLCRRQHIDSAD